MFPFGKKLFHVMNYLSSDCHNFSAEMLQQFLGEVFTFLNFLKQKSKMFCQFEILFLIPSNHRTDFYLFQPETVSCLELIF